MLKGLKFSIGAYVEFDNNITVLDHTAQILYMLSNAKSSHEDFRRKMNIGKILSKQVS